MNRYGCLTFYLAVVLSLQLKDCLKCGHKNPQRLRASFLSEDFINSPGYPDDYPNNADCAWHIYTDHDYVINLHVQWISMETYDGCAFDNVTIYDGRSKYYPIMGTICTHDERFNNYYSTGSDMYIRFRSDFNTHDHGFRLSYMAVYHTYVSTTTRWYTPGYETTTTAGGFQWRTAHINTAALIGGITGGLLLLFMICAFCRYYYSHSYASRHALRHAPRPCYPAQAPHAASAPPASTVFQNSNAVFMVSSGADASGTLAPPGLRGNTNYAFSPSGEAPPAYFAVAGGGPAGERPFVGAGFFPAPPSYTEAMMMSHPPAVAPSYTAVVTAQDLSAGGSAVPLPPPPPPPPVPIRPAPPPPFGPPPRRGQALPPIGPTTPSFGSVSSPLGTLPPLPGVAPSH